MKNAPTLRRGALFYANNATTTSHILSSPNLGKFWPPSASVGHNRVLVCPLARENGAYAPTSSASISSKMLRPLLGGLS
jgi:hypothetical protein